MRRPGWLPLRLRNGLLPKPRRSPRQLTDRGVPPCSVGSVMVTGPVNSVAANRERLAVTWVVPTVAAMSRVRGPMASLVMLTWPADRLPPDRRFREPPSWM